MAKVGRPKWLPTEKTIEDLERLAAQGLSKRQICQCLGISYSTLLSREKEFTEFSDALEKGKAQAIQIVTNELFNMATGKSTAGKLGAIVFWLKNHAGWRDRVEHSNDPERPMPSGLSKEELSGLAQRIVEEGRSKNPVS